jgi:LuxR family maltose regulon positive regulatory protein
VALLRARARVDDPRRVESRERRAARWFDAHGLAADAEVHAVRGRDWEMVARLALARWLDGIVADGACDDLEDPLPPGTTADGPALRLLASARALVRHDEPEAERLLADTAGEHERDAEPDCVAARALLLAEHARRAGASWCGDDALGALQTAADRCGPRADALRSISRLRAAEFALDGGDLGAARRHASVACAAPTASSFPWVAAEAAALLALCDALDGAPAGAAARLAAGSDGADGVGIPEAARITTALVHLLRNEPMSARTALQEDREQRSSIPPPRAVAAVTRLVEAVVARVPVLPYGADPDALHPLARYALVELGDVDALGPRAAAALPESARMLGAARASLVRDPATALHLGAQIAADTEAHVATAVEGNVVVAIAARALGDDERAVTALVRACRIAAPADLRISFARHAAGVADLFERFGAQLGAEQAFALVVLDGLRGGDGPVFVEPLTARERAVLRYLPTLMSNAEIAGEMFVSVNTVKTHLKAVYRKLGVERRREAVERARHLELV